MPTVIKHENQLTSTRTLTLPDIFDIEVCLTSDSTLEKGGADDVLLLSTEINSGGADNSLQPFSEIQNAN